MECNVSELVKRGHDQVAELKSSCGAVDVRDVAQLIIDLATQLDVQLARSNALAAENAGLKQTESNLVRNIINDLGDTEFQYSRVHTPATDAFLAEVRAQGVEMFAIEINNLHKQTNQGSYNDYAIKSAVTWATDFAAQLRKGVQS
ncbi:hypothetical protein KFP53_00490 [Enterobacter hormaechei]|uniref:hypothetical protein n=1 Tax=Enterobacter hormaechei TaxID=158836 RepID=UPI00190B0E49|nr:hypothetical protein [Enterobacter hormaechei]MBK3088148.1 hypothetical protein [Enterobacter hormaechei]MBS0808072.1 hypothetical protein [Enterobacter hormaechei]MBS0817732.1 hypothetical protein [Enterobacter hormaechei]MBS0819157.1 hypothetical protein [Enterobacter hormaechei]MBS0828236.1 hypothetical protein [Enterobacter hormaechei]